MEIEPLAVLGPDDEFPSCFAGNACVRDPAEVCIVSSDEEEVEVKAPVGSKNVLERRVSPRLQSQVKKDKPEPECGKRKPRSSCNENKGRKKSTVDRMAKSVIPESNGDGEDGHLVEGGLENGNCGQGEENIYERRALARVKKTLRIFNGYYLHFTQEEEKRCKRENCAKEKQCKMEKSTSRSKVEDIKRPSKRPDLKAITEMIKTNAVLYPKGKVGHLPGIHVGYQFFSRAEMVVVGLHNHWLNGIDYLGQQFSKLEEYKSYTFPIAVSIVMSGQYEDDLDNAEKIVYTGQGGNDLLGKKCQVGDQLMIRGNLALKNSMEHKVPIRVTRGHVSGNSYCGKIYTYDGLYKVINYWAEKGLSGFTVYKYHLQRLEGQPDLTTNQVYFIPKHIPKVPSKLYGLVCEDISGGQENIPIPATNVVDDPPTAPTGFVYCNSIQIRKGIKIPSNVVGCNCKGVCVDPRICSCGKLNGFEFPYVRRDGGRLVKAKDVVFECGPNCKCGPECVNRTSQHGLKYRLEVFRTTKKGWAVRSWDSIPSGAPICEYLGIIRRTDEEDSILDNNFIFDIDCLQTMEGLDGRESRLGEISSYTKAHLARNNDNKAESGPEFCIDAGTIGSVSRFINHSCQPNLFVQCVLSSHHDIKLARIMLFAADNIPPLQELTYDYGYALNSVVDPDGTIKTMPCYCGAPDCRKRLY